MRLQVELIDNSYAEEVIDIILPIQQLEFNVPITLEDQPDLLDIEASYFATGGAFWGAKVDGELVGTLAMIRFTEDSVALRKMFVKKEFRGGELGVAKHLLDTLIAYCQENGITDLYLGTVSMLKAAMRFYEKNGFEEVFKTELPESFPGMKAETNFYRMRLNKI